MIFGTATAGMESPAAAGLGIEERSAGQSRAELVGVEIEGYDSAKLEYAESMG